MKQRIIYLSWPTHEVSGGIKMIFRHVEALNENGFEAMVASADGKPPNWFRTTAPIINLDALAPGDDILVFPENTRDLLHKFAAWTNPKIVFCQNLYQVHRGLGDKMSYAAFGVSTIIACGWTTAMFCQRRFPDLTTRIVPNYIDHALFSMPAGKALQIAYLPRKRQLEADVIRDLFAWENPEFRDVPWVKIEKLPESAVASTLRQSAVFLSLVRFEASPLTILEAMACGCITAGFTGFGGREFTSARNGFWAEEDDCFDCTRQLVQACRLVKNGGHLFHTMVEQAFTTAQQFPRGAFVKTLLDFFREFASAADQTRRRN